MFSNLREIVQKYDECPIKHFKILFQKLLEQLNEIDDARQNKEDQELQGVQPKLDE